MIEQQKLETDCPFHITAMIAVLPFGEIVAFLVWLAVWGVGFRGLGFRVYSEEFRI